LPAISPSCAGSAVEAITKSTGKSPPPGSAGGMIGMTRMPGMRDSRAEASIWSSAVLLCRSFHGLVTMPLNPPVG